MNARAIGGCRLKMNWFYFAIRLSVRLEILHILQKLFFESSRFLVRFLNLVWFDEFFAQLRV